jgi:very-long-chain (3R)-3-hydroxyacyl-CoA dehydratase
LTNRYNLFIILYPIGASSEAFLSLSTLPPLSTLNFQNVLSSPNPISALVKHVVKSLPLSMKAKLMKTSIGKHALWKMAKATVTKKTKDYWGFIEVARLILFFIWWPGTSI